MTVVRDFEGLYRTVSDPWDIGAADSPRYERYVELLLPHAGGAVLDVGCGFGAMLSRLAPKASSLDGVEISASAIAKGSERFPFINFHHGSAANLDAIDGVRGRKFDLIICSDVIYYLKDKEKSALLEWINRHLSSEGKAFVAAWCPGRRYPTPDELAHLTESHLVLDHCEPFVDSGHLALVCRRRRRFVAVTIDYETWHPIPDGKRIDWNADIFQPTDRLFKLFERAGVAATLFAEMGEYFWLVENDPEIAHRMEAQWREAVRLGHDVQLHLHPCWLPETGARHSDGRWTWNWSQAKADDYSGDLTELIGRCKRALECAIRPVKPDFTVTTFRAGAYQIQPFKRLSDALIANEIFCDSSVFPHGSSIDRGFDFSHPYTTHQPYFADLLDPQFKAVPAEERIVELPIFTPERGRRWFVDNDEADQFAARLICYERRSWGSFSTPLYRSLAKLRHYARAIYHMTGEVRLLVNRILPRTLAHALIANSSPRRFRDLFYVAIGHTKADLRIDALERNFRVLRDVADVEYVTISEMARHSRAELTSVQRKSAQEEIEYQVRRELTAILGEERNSEQSYRLQEMIPLDVSRVLDFGCGAGYWSARIAELYPWTEVTGIDAGTEFIAKAREVFGGPRTRFEVGDFTKLGHPDGAFDCVYADNTLEHSFDLERALSEIYRVLARGGSLVAALPVDGVNPDQDCDNHTWKTVRSQVILRLEQAGFTNVTAKEVDTYRELGMPPYRPSNDRMLYVRAWKGAGEGDQLKRALQAMEWLYHRIAPTKPNLSEDPKKIIADGYAYCIGYSVALGKLLTREGYVVTWITMVASGHERGRGSEREDSHEVIEISLDGVRCVFDPMANTFFPYSIDELLQNPKLADVHANVDSRCQERGYNLYNTSYWYSRVTKISRRRNMKFPSLLWRRVRK